MPKRRVGLTQRVEDLPDRGERRDALDQRWAVLLDAVGLVPVAVPNRLPDPGAFVGEAELSLLVLTGGNDLAALPGAQATAPERDETEAALLEHAAATRLPVLGVCRGLQMMVHHAGGRLERVEGHVAQPHRITVCEPDGLLRDGRVVNSFHDWGIGPSGLAGEFTALAFAPDGTVEAARHRSLPFVGVMWHPERDDDPAEDLALLHALIEEGT